MKSNIKIFAPKGAKLIIETLEKNGFSAYAVGGCVRDSLLGKTPYDWDITTSALPEKIMEIFSGFEVIPTGLKHGTVTVRIDGQNYEVTTFRTESGYSDSRHPEKVEFVSDLKEDLRRRDFTVNAMAYNEKDGLIDLYGGFEDLNGKIIRAVGNPEERFIEDALRILRGVRFSATLGFKIEEKTFEAMRKHKGLLDKISVERVFAEMDKLLVGKSVENALLDYSEIIFQIIPELKKSHNFLQHTKWHLHDVYTHTVIALSAIKADCQLRWCMLLHDVGKPDTFFLDENGAGHFYGHPEVSEKIAREVFKRLKSPTAFKQRVCLLIKYHDKPFPNGRTKLKRLLNELGEKTVLDLCEIKLADNFGQGTQLALAENKTVLDKKAEIEQIINSGECYKLKDLKISGQDAIDCGFKGEEIGAALGAVLDDVINENVPNDRELLIKSFNKNQSISR